MMMPRNGPRRSFRTGSTRTAAPFVRVLAMYFRTSFRNKIGTIAESRAGAEHARMTAIDVLPGEQAAARRTANP
jgi:hypothetical protein